MFPQSVGGIILPEAASKKNEGEVVAVGPGMMLKDGSRAPLSVVVGEAVSFVLYSVNLARRKIFRFAGAAARVRRCEG